LYGIGAKVSADFTLLTDVAVLQQHVLISFLEDQVALEYDETFYLKLKPRSSGSMITGPNIIFCDTLNITVTDSDGMIPTCLSAM
jgi:hypothetical protein